MWNSLSPLPLYPLEEIKSQRKSFSCNTETLTEAVQCTDDQEGAHAGHSWDGAGTFLGGKTKIIRSLCVVEFCQCQ